MDLDIMAVQKCVDTSEFSFCRTFNSLTITHTYNATLEQLPVNKLLDVRRNDMLKKEKKKYV